MKNTIVVDIDSTLYSFIHAYAHVARRDHGVECGLDPEEWNALLSDFADPAVAIGMFPRAYDHDMIEFNTPYEGAVAGLGLLVRAGYPLAYFTDRPSESVNATKAWLQHYGFPEGELHVCHDKRAEIMDRRDEILTIVDDRPRTLVWGRFELGLDHVFSLRHGYNRALSDIPGVVLRDSWAELAPEMVIQLGGLRRGAA